MISHANIKGSASAKLNLTILNGEPAKVSQNLAGIDWLTHGICMVSRKPQHKKLQFMAATDKPAKENGFLS